MKLPLRKNNFEINNLSRFEFDIEWEYRKQERLGILIDGDRVATVAENLSAAVCADEIFPF